jgi:hypothetical protein
VEETYKMANFRGLMAKTGSKAKQMTKHARAAMLQAPKTRRRSHLLTVDTTCQRILHVRSHDMGVLLDDSRAVMRQCHNTWEYVESIRNAAPVRMPMFSMVEALTSKVPFLFFPSTRGR